MTSAVRQLEILNQRGLHARAAAKFVTIASTFGAKIDVCHGGTEVCGTSIMGLMMLAASKGTVISVRAAPNARWGAAKSSCDVQASTQENPV